MGCSWIEVALPRPAYGPAFASMKKSWNCLINVFRLGVPPKICYMFFMPNSADAWRRWFGLLFLALAFGLLIWGQTVLRQKLHGISFLIYWSFCFVMTF